MESKFPFIISNGHDFKVRDLRKKEQFIIDDVYLNGYGKIFGPIGTAVYLSLCRRAGKQQSCWPSEKKIAADHGITDRTVRKYIKIFAEANLISIEHERTQSGKWPHNIYYLLDKSEWKKPEEIISAGDRRKLTAPPEENNQQNRRKQFPPKDAQVKDAHKKDHPDKKTFDENKSIPINEFEPKSNEESRCLEIARWLDEKDMNFVLLHRARYGLHFVEKAYGIVKEDDVRKGIKNRASYFNAVIRNLLDSRGHSFPKNKQSDAPTS
jgi:hypothetical protein